jgi:hypothetical protein
LLFKDRHNHIDVIFPTVLLLLSYVTKDKRQNRWAMETFKVTIIQGQREFEITN